MDTTTSLPNNPDAAETSTTSTVAVVAGEATDGATANAASCPLKRKMTGAPPRCPCRPTLRGRWCEVAPFSRERAEMLLASGRVA
jgi:hypothetical protein